jgi:exodeoxyribonuclease V beta subunit
VRLLLDRLAADRVPTLAFAPGEIPGTHCFKEWPFHLPLAATGPREVARLFARHGRGRVGREYPERLATLGEGRVQGLLAGVIDMVAEHEGRWYVWDWKSNHMGHGPADYDDPALWRCMADHHYVLQYHLYVLALDRYLESRMTDYDYDRHCGGAIYCFLRGLGGGGWYVDRPPRELVAALAARCPVEGKG